MHHYSEFYWQADELEMWMPVWAEVASYGLLIYGTGLFIKEPNFKHWFYLILMASAAWAWFKGYLSAADANKSAVKWSTDGHSSGDKRTANAVNGMRGPPSSGPHFDAPQSGHKFVQLKIMVSFYRWYERRKNAAPGGKLRAQNPEPKTHNPLAQLGDGNKEIYDPGCSGSLSDANAVCLRLGQINQKSEIKVKRFPEQGRKLLAPLLATWSMCVSWSGAS